MPPKDKAGIDKADQDRLEAILAGKLGSDPSYKAAYDYAVQSVLDQIDRLLAFKDPTRNTYRIYIFKEIKARNLDMLNQGVSTPTVQFNFTFKNGEEEAIEVQLDYDNPGHDPEKTLEALIGKEMEKDPKRKWDKIKNKEAKKLIADLPKGRWRIYPHFGWNLSYKKTKLTGHSYITFNAMLMERASRPKDVTADKRIKEETFSVEPEAGMTCVSTGYKWEDYPTARLEMRIDKNIKAAEDFIKELE